MAENNKHIKPYTAADIQRYLNGQMSAPERHALEKAALEDPFLEEAITGYSLQTDHDVTAAIDEIKKRIRERTVSGRSLIAKTGVWWSAAAAILILTGAALTWYWLSPAGKNIAQQQKKEQTVKALQEIQPAGSAELDTNETATNETQQNPATKDSETYEAEVSGGEINLGGRIAPGQPAEAVNANKKSLLRKARSVPVAANQEQAASAVTGYTITGKVTDNKHTPLPFVNIQLLNEQRITYTDAKGNFNLFVSDSILSAEIKAVGFQAQKVTLLSSTAENYIVLQPYDNAAANAVPASEDNRSIPTGNVKDTNTINQGAEPVDGWDKYEIYLANNTRFPEAGSNGTQRVVRLGFSVDQYGKLSNFKILHSTCAACNGEAIRLIKEGPGWKLIRPNQKSQVSVIISF